MKPRSRLKLTLTDESHLATLATMKLTRGRILIGVFLLLSVVVVIGFLIVVATPLKTLVPGYFRESQREASQLALMRIDSLHEAYIRNQNYLSGLREIFDTERNVVSMRVVESSGRPVPADSLLLPSKEERRFVGNMQEKEKFNISVVAPMAAEGMLFYPVSEVGIVTHSSREALKAKIAMPVNGSVSAIADATVLALFYDSSLKYASVLLQHPNGFVSRYSGLSKLLISEGERVAGGQIIGFTPPATPGKEGDLTVELWHDGIPLRPYSYISSHHSYSSLNPS